MYQSGEVDYLVATDAIGMGLNMDVDHVAFAALAQVRRPRSPAGCAPAEIAQIAGRAGRHMNDGTFGTTDRCRRAGRGDGRGDREPPLRSAARPAMAQRGARFPLGSGADRVAQRAAARMPRCNGCASRTTSSPCRPWRSDSEFLPACTRRDVCKLLWEVCQVPDFRKTMTEEHTAPARPALPASHARAASACPKTGSTVTSSDSTVRWRHRHA